MKKLSSGLALSLLLGAAVWSVGARAAVNPKAEEGVFVIDPAKRHIGEIRLQPDLTIDHLNGRGYEVYGPMGFSQRLRTLGIPYVAEAKPRKFMDYPTPEQMAEHLQKIAQARPDITRLFSIGNSSQGRPLWVMKVSGNAGADEVKPEAKYIANMHGDEIAGRELMVKLIDELVGGYNKSQAIKALVDNTAIYIMPSMNPDGSVAQQRANAQGVDLNRNFPDFTTSDNQNTPTGRAPETQAVMLWERARHFALSANFHGGAEVVNYPWDTQPQLFPLDALIKGISVDYASKVPYMANSREFPGGVTNGYAWYEVNGGMQDWSYYWHGDMQVTIELTGTKWPAYTSVAQTYDLNRASLLGYLSAVHQGAGFVMARPGIAGEVTITKSTGERLGSFRYSGSYFYKVLEPGDYRFDISEGSALGVRRPFGAASINVSVAANHITAHGNFTRLP